MRLVKAFKIFDYAITVFIIFYLLDFGMISVFVIDCVKVSWSRLGKVLLSLSQY